MLVDARMLDIYWHDAVLVPFFSPKISYATRIILPCLSIVITHQSCIRVLLLDVNDMLLTGDTPALFVLSLHTYPLNLQ